MRLIDADVLKQHIDKLPALPDGNFAGNHSALKALINMQPTVQPEIIHCGECGHYKPMSNHWGKCGVHSSPAEKYRTCQICDYCSWSERRNDEMQ